MTNSLCPARVQAFCSYWLPPLLLTGGILICAGDLGSFKHTRFIITMLQYLVPSLTPGQAKQVYVYLRKIGHFLAYASLCYTWVRALRWHLDYTSVRAVILALAISLGVAILDEGRQSFFTTRTGNPWDVMLDFSGALTATLAFFLSLHYRSLINKAHANRRRCRF